MTLNERITDLLGKATRLPVDQDRNDDGKSDVYIIFIYEDEHPTHHGDNEVLADEIDLQIQLFSPKEFNYLETKKIIRNTLEKAGFIVSSIRSFLGDQLTGTENTRQTIFSVSWLEGRQEE